MKSALLFVKEADAGGRLPQAIAELAIHPEQYDMADLVPPRCKKSDFFVAADVLPHLPDKVLKPLLPGLFEWFQDMNWPGAIDIMARVQKMPKDDILPALSAARDAAAAAHDSEWRMYLNEYFPETAKLLFIGSTVADVVVRLPNLPRTGDDINIIGQQTSLGGCAYNAFHTARLTGKGECTLFSPVGAGVWGDWVRHALSERGIVSAAPPVDTPNGCCYCLVEPDGERTFLCEHGAEYFFRPEWFAALGNTVFDGVYLCGLEVEESTGDHIIDWLEAHPPRRLYFAPGPRIAHIPPAKLARLIRLGPVMHMNAAELCQFTQAEDISAGAALLQSLTRNDVIVTLGGEGAYIRSGSAGEIIPGFPAEVVDTIGAGDSHIGAVMAAEAAGLALPDAVERANRVSAAVVAQAGAELSADAWSAIQANERRMNP